MESNRRTSAWASLSVGALTVIPAVLGANVSGLLWLLYLSGAVLAISTLILIWDRFLTERFHRYLVARKSRSALRKYGHEYQRYLSKLKLLEELDRALGTDRINWSKGRPQFFGGSMNTPSIIEYHLKDLPKEHLVVTSNVMLVILVRAFDAWLLTCDGILQSGNAKYLNERSKNDLISLVREFQSLVSSHDLLCERINEEAGKDIVMSFYCQKHCFDWNNASS